MECAALPAKSARASSPRKLPLATAQAERTAVSPKRASSSGWSGNASGPRMSSARAGQRSTQRPSSRSQASASGPSVAPVAAMDRSSIATRPSSKG